MCPCIYLVSDFALTFYALLYWNLPSLSNYVNLCCYHLKHNMCHLIEVPYFLPCYTIPFYIGLLYYMYSCHICPLSFLVFLKLQLIQQWCTVVLPGVYLDLGLIYGALNLVFCHALYHNLIHCQYIVYSDLSLLGYHPSWHFVYFSELHNNHKSTYILSICAFHHILS